MNYRHAFHAGNFADVFKHALLAALIEALKRKAAPFCYLETHAGAGRYRLDSAETQKTGEAMEGIARLVGLESPPPALAPYLGALGAASGLHAMPVEYPGSPLIAARLMRTIDRLVLCEVAVAEHAALALEFARDVRVSVQARDGYAALKALLPPRERRGLILIDPPFEAQEQEFAGIEAALVNAFARFATGVYAIWYPIKRQNTVAPFRRWLAACGRHQVLIVELLLSPPDSALRLNGCGMAIVNTPFGFDRSAKAILGTLTPRLARNAGSRFEVQWLRRD
jgi:23S rRNA (adenine2030-N6)-methyltransferase